MGTAVLPRDRAAPGGTGRLSAQAARGHARHLSLAAGLTPLRGAVLAAVPGLADVPGGCAVIVLDPAAAAVDVRDWMRQAEAAARERGAREVRVHLDGPAPALERELRSRGYARALATVLLAPPGPAPGEGVRLAPVSGPLWHEVRRLHGGDGRECELLRRKQEAGGLECHLIEREGRWIGAAALVPMPDVLVIVQLAAPGEGPAGLAGALGAVWRIAQDRGAAAGLIAPAASPPAAAALRAGWRPAGGLARWARRPPARRRA
jgi:hypothetical protein